MSIRDAATAVMTVQPNGVQTSTGSTAGVETNPEDMKFDDLVQSITLVHTTAANVAGQAVHRLLSLRNWLIGAYIVEFEQHGDDRAAYGKALMRQLAEALTHTGCKGLSFRNLNNFRQVALSYPKLDASRLGRRLLPSGSKEPSVRTSASFDVPAFPALTQREDPGTVLPWYDSDWLHRLFTSLTFSHLLELARVEEPLKRAFYELYCLKERWSVRELQRQRGSLLYERIGLSRDKDAVLALAREGVVASSPALVVRDPYVLEFIGLKPRPSFTEAELEQALIDHLQEFLLELGRDFCFVDRQFRITLGNRHHYLDLLFFHRSLRCLVAIDLKVGDFEPSHVGQMSFYLNYLAENLAHPGENPPVGILLCSGKDAEVVRYATAGTADAVFVSRYLLELPQEEQLARWLHDERALLESTLAEEE